MSALFFGKMLPTGETAYTSRRTGLTYTVALEEERVRINGPNITILTDVRDRADAMRLIELSDLAA